MARALALLAAIAMCGGCARRAVVRAAPTQPQIISSAPASGGYAGGRYAAGSGSGGYSASGSYVPGPGTGQVVVLGSDLRCQFGAVRLQLTAQGQFYVDGTFVGTFTADGGFYNAQGQEIGRLFDNGRMQYAGTMQDAGIANGQIISPQGTIAYIDGRGSLVVPGGSVGPAPVLGLTTPTVRTFLFAFSMFGALLDTAQRMGY